jgi:hypothetical protein
VRVPPVAAQRLARPADVEQISALMRASVLDHFPRFYDDRQVTSAALYIARLDVKLIEDATYFVHEPEPGEIVACGGWSRRGRLHAGAGDAPDDERLLDPRSEPARVRAMFVRSDWVWVDLPCRRGGGAGPSKRCTRAANGRAAAPSPHNSRRTRCAGAERRRALGGAGYPRPVLSPTISLTSSCLRTMR